MPSEPSGLLSLVGQIRIVSPVLLRIPQLVVARATVGHHVLHVVNQGEDALRRVRYSSGETKISVERDLIRIRSSACREIGVHPAGSTGALSRRRYNYAAHI